MGKALEAQMDGMMRKIEALSLELAHVSASAASVELGPGGAPHTGILSGQGHAGHHRLGKLGSGRMIALPTEVQ
eukprot:762999-Amphidinium_carterae.1